jgi:hypothetical protein
MAKVAILTDTTFKTFIIKESALEYHYKNGGNLWIRKNSLSIVQKGQIQPYASGTLPKHLKSKYNLYMVNGREPTKEEKNSSK